ncbi:MAG: phosphate ABC transporter permease subunit PstC, partial [Clostridia bacterium]|nr:phosphate ABC transporter permease subunit PstC [Clostridia bacterium]
MPYRRARGDTVFRFLSAAAAMAVLAVAAALVLVLVDASAPAIARFGLAFLASGTWDPIHHEYGALPFVFGTLYTSLLAMLFAVPVGLGAALCLSEMAGYRLASTLGFAVEFLAAVPSVIYGL